MLNELSILVFLSVWFKIIFVSANLRSYKSPSFIIISNLLSFLSFICLISVVKFLTDNSFVKLIDALETFPENP